MEFQDPTFGDRAAFVHRKLQEAPPAAGALDAIARQVNLVGQLRHINRQLKVCA